MRNIKNIGELKKTGYQPKTIRDELSDNLKNNLRSNKNSFEGLIGYDNTVIPDLERAILSNHNINLLGLRGQAKTRIARQMTNLLDEWIPVVEGSEINDDPIEPISNFAKEKIKKLGDKTPVYWMHRSERFYEKLATPDVTVADLIGDIDPIKAATLKLSYADEKVIHFGMIPRAHRCIFVLNELPDLQARIQVALFSILQEKEIQIRGFKLRLPIECQLIFTANPEDYTNRGSIVTPLKDRIGSQILTHYPRNRSFAKKITIQEAKKAISKTDKIYIPELAYDIIEQIGFEARKSDYIDHKSGVSARMSITSLENLISSAERRILINNESKTTIRLSDFSAVISAINGKVELVYEGEQEGAEQISYYLISQSIKTIFPEFFPKIEKLEKPDAKGPYEELLAWFFKDNQLYIDDNFSDDEYRSTLKSIKPLEKFIKNHKPNLVDDEKYFMMEFLLWGLEANKKLNKYRSLDGFEFKDSLGSYISKL